MKIIGCDFHPSYQQIAMVATETGELWEGRLEHERGEARRFYHALQGQPVRVGMEAVGNAQWFERMLAALGQELWIGDAAQIRQMVVRLQKTDRRDAQHILQLLLDGRFPRLWVPSAAMRDVRQLLRHRQKLVEMRTQMKNQLQHLALNQGVQRKRRLWSREGRAVLEGLPLEGWTARRRADLLAMLDRLQASPKLNFKAMAWTKNEGFFAALRGCDFFDFSQKAALKTTGLDAKKSSYRNKVTSSQNDNVKPKQIVRAPAGHDKPEAKSQGHALDQRMTDDAVCQEAWQRPAVRLLMSHPGVGPVTGLAYVLTIGPVARFPRGKQVAKLPGPDSARTPYCAGSK